MTGTLQLHLLGEFRLMYDHTPVMTLNTPRLQSLLAYLVLHRQSPQSRHQLAFLFWPDSTEKQAHTNLRNLLYRLRHALPEIDTFLHIDSQVIQWRPATSFSLDVTSFENAAAEDNSPEALQTAVALYQGDLLPACYDEWILPERERLRQAFFSSLERLIHFLEEQRDYQAAIRYAQLLLQHDPIHEATHRNLIRLRALNGDRAGALRAYHTCATVLHRELAVEPSPATRAVYERLLNLETAPEPDAASSTTFVSTTALVGRQQAWDTLQTIWQTTLQDQSSFVSIAGDAGIGKTRLAEELFRWASRQGISTASAQCYSAEGRLAYAPLAAWLRTPMLKKALLTLDQVWLNEVVRILPELVIERPDLTQPGPLTESWQRRRLFEALARATLARVSRQHPLLLQLDDIQWCDQETLEWLHYLLHFDPKSPILIVSTHRPEEIEPDHPVMALLLALGRSQQLAEIELEPLDAVQTTTLASTVANQELSPVVAAQLYRETEGNPLFTIETIRAGFLENTESDRPALSTVPIKTVSPTIQAVIAARLAQLSPSAQKLVGLAATIGRAFTFDVLAQASAEDEDTLVHGLDELWQRRILREQGADAYDFSHGKLREAAYARLSAAHRHLTHRRIAQALEAVHASNLDAVNGQIGGHYERAGLPGPAITYYQRAAKAAQQLYAHSKAIRYYRQALALLTAMPARNRKDRETLARALQLYEGLGDVLALTGHYDAAKKSYQNALNQTPGVLEQTRLYQKTGNTWRSQHHYDEALHAYQLAEDAQKSPTVQAAPEQHQAWIQTQLERMWVYYWLNQWPKIEDLAKKSQPVVKTHGTPAQRINFLLSLSTIQLRRNCYVVSGNIVELCREAVAISQQSGPSDEMAWAQFMLGFTLLWSGDLAEAEKQMLAALNVAERTGDVVHQSRCLTYLAVVYRKRGLVELTRDFAVRSLATASDAQMEEYVGTAKANLAWVAWREGNLPETLVPGQAALAAWQQLPSGHASCCFQWTALWPLIAVSLTREQLAEAADYAQRLLIPPQQCLPGPLTELIEEALHVWKQDQPQMTKAHLEQAIELAEEIGYL